MYLTKVLLTVALAQCAFAVGQDEQKSTESPEDNNMCGICQENDETVVTLICGCFAHSDCMGQYIKANANVSMLRCFGHALDPQCNHVITPEQIAQYGTEKDVETNEKLSKSVVDGQRQREENAQSDPEIEARRARGEEYCPENIEPTACKCTGKMCECEGFKQCPGCGNLLQKSGACNHYTHSKRNGGCGCEFCWTCGGPCVPYEKKYSGRYVDYNSSGCSMARCHYVGPARPGYCVKRTREAVAQRAKKANAFGANIMQLMRRRQNRQNPKPKNRRRLIKEGLLKRSYLHSAEQVLRRRRLMQMLEL
jgi:hypothetical protein